MLKVLQERRLSSGQLGELDANSAIIHLKDANANVDVVLHFVLKVIGSTLGKLDFVLVLTYLELNFVVLQVLQESLFDHVRVVR